MSYDYFRANRKNDGYLGQGPNISGQKMLREYLQAHRFATPRILQYLKEGCSQEPRALAKDLSKIHPRNKAIAECLAALIGQRARPRSS